MAFIYISFVPARRQSPPWVLVLSFRFVSLLRSACKQLAILRAFLALYIPIYVLYTGRLMQ